MGLAHQDHALKALTTGFMMGRIGGWYNRSEKGVECVASKVGGGVVVGDVDGETVGAACLGVLFLAVDSQPVLASLIRLESMRHKMQSDKQGAPYFARHTPEYELLSESRIDHCTFSALVT